MALTTVRVDGAMKPNREAAVTEVAVKAVAVATEAVAVMVMEVGNLPVNSKPFVKKAKVGRSASDALARRRIEGRTPAP